jgi:ferredoxin-NADP reductase
MISMTAMVAVKGRLRWRSARIIEVIAETSRTRSIVIEAPGWEGHRPGQHVDVRLTSEHGSRIQRSYSIASSPQKERLTLLVGRLQTGELASCLFDELRQGDELDLRGPMGVSFSWESRMGGPSLLVAGGCGIAPLMSMIRQRAAVGDKVPTRLLYSSRSPDDIAYRGELDRFARSDGSLEVIHTLTRAQPPGWMGYSRRIDNEMLDEISWRPEEKPLAFLCGPTPMVKTVATGLVELGHDPARVKRPRASYRR